MNDQTDPSPDSDDEIQMPDTAGFRHAAEKVRSFPSTPGVYLMKDDASRVIYIGKAKSLRSRAGSYFLKQAAKDSRTSLWIGEIADIDYMDCESEVEAVLMESRLIKDIQPKYNRTLKDDKSFPYLMITTEEIEHVRARVDTAGWARQTLNRILKDADGFLQKPPKFLHR